MFPKICSVITRKTDLYRLFPERNVVLESALPTFPAKFNTWAVCHISLGVSLGVNKLQEGRVGAIFGAGVEVALVLYDTSKDRCLPANS
jgi:hypothetical protein